MNLKIDELETPAAESGHAYTPTAGAIASATIAPASVPVNGRQRLIEAAIRLANQNGGINAVGMRELAREAGLNPNTFYRHFDSIDDLGVAVLETVLPSLSEGLRVRRSQITSFGESSRETIAYFFEFVDAHPKSITFAARELNGPSTRLRETLAAAIAGITEDLVSAILRNRWAPFASEAVIRDISDTVIKQLFSLALDYESQQQDHAEVVARAERFVLMMFAGAYFVETLKLDLNSAPALLGVSAGAGKKA